jgi:hypothetical protein
LGVFCMRELWRWVMAYFFFPFRCVPCLDW